ncbi:hypothetical protein [Paraburkholderia gardini]|uniref:hypothetical protein n=1 Tax=Paraburkholderia gardini TaxID=2823469 RepID=UPI001E5FA147|nr:hypothetical protein [Paraburkholderia gardini]
MQGVVYLLDQPLKTLKLSTALEGKYFLRPVHSSTMTSTRIGAPEPTVVRFFSDADRAIVFCFCPIDNTTDGAVGVAWRRANQCVEPDSRVEEVGRFVWSNNAFETSIGEMSMFLRGSATLTEDCYQDIGRLKAAVDAKGMVVFSSEPGGERAGRALAAYMLGLAYHRVLEEAINDLAETCRNGSLEIRAEPMHAEISRFLASYYFEAPARVATTEVGPLYVAIRDRLLLGPLCRELVDQLSRIAEISRMQRTAAESAFETKLQKRLAIFGVLIGLLGLAQLTQTTPSQVQSFAVGWKSFFTGSPVPSGSPATPTSEAKEPGGHTKLEQTRSRRSRHDAYEQADPH